MGEHNFTPEEVATLKFKKERRLLGGLLLKLAAVSVAPVLLGGDRPDIQANIPRVLPPSEKTPAPEREPKQIGIPLIADIPPIAKYIQEAKDSGLLSSETQPFDIPAFFDRLTGANYGQLQRDFQLELKNDWPLYGDEGTRYLLANGMEKEALCLSLAYGWSSHGESVAQAMRNYRDQQETVIKKREQDPKYPNDPSHYMDSQESKPEFKTEPYEILPLQNFITRWKFLVTQMNLEILLTI